jgi:hypothetical protein
MGNPAEYHKQAVVWDYYKPRHTHAWNMLVLSRHALDKATPDFDDPFRDEYLWENFIIRLWLYRTTIKTLVHFSIVQKEAVDIVAKFDACFTKEGKNSLKAIRDMIEHFDDYAGGLGRGPATREGELDPWRTVTTDRFERGPFVIEGAAAYEAAIQMRTDAKRISDIIITWLKDMEARIT